MAKFNKTDYFEAWLAKLKDDRAKQRIAERIDYAEAGNFGDCESVGDGISEMKIHYGPGYRLYYCQRGATLYLLLIGGGKGTKKAQTSDIRRAKAIKKEIEEGDKW